MMMKYDKISYEDFIKKAENLYKNNDDIEKIKKAYQYALKMHEGRKRLTNEDYIMHPLNVAYILLSLNVDV